MAGREPWTVRAGLTARKVQDRLVERQTSEHLGRAREQVIAAQHGLDLATTSGPWRVELEAVPRLAHETDCSRRIGHDHVHGLGWQLPQEVEAVAVQEQGLGA